MPSPIGHSIVGYLGYRYGFQNKENGNMKAMFFCILCANLPDLDFLPGLIIGQSDRFHGGISHSMGVSFILASIMPLALSTKNAKGLGRIWLLLLGIFISHPILDFLAIDTGYPFGKPLFWPISADYYQSPILLFSDVWRSPSSSDFFISLFSWHNFYAVLREILVMSSLIALLKMALITQRRFKEGLIKDMA